MSIVGPRAKEAHFTNKWLRFTLREVAHFYFARNSLGFLAGFIKPPAIDPFNFHG
jgi:hypothetical protein